MARPPAVRSPGPSKARRRDRPATRRRDTARALPVVSVVPLLLVGALAGCTEPAPGAGFPSHPDHPRVTLTTSAGDVVLELFPDHAPVTVANFLAHVEAGFYDGLVFHRVIQGFVVQGGGHWPNGALRPAMRDPIPLEVHPALTHRDGCVGMARGLDPSSATSQFYLCDGPQHRLDDAVRQAERGERGYAVFGRVAEGMEVVRSVAALRTDSLDRPLYQPTIVGARLVP